MLVFFPIICGHWCKYYLWVLINKWVNQLIGHPRVLSTKYSNDKWGVIEFNLYDYGITTFVTPLL